ncbi:MAG TPA: pyridoxamine 5'-phosphate oxidase family protein [Candidatus Limnocylindria bacterium]|nr:pyridoxamine 5'-phosphate oxidase family protein [Candidatus Limnocylindria bacterium]
MKTKNLDIYGNAALPWSRARDLLDAMVTEGGQLSWFLSTVRPDGKPHATAVGVFWDGGKFWFTTGPKTRKGRDIAANPNVVLSAGLKGLDLIVEGRAVRVMDAAALERFAKIARDQGWPTQVQGDALTAPYSAPSAGRPPWYLYVVTPLTAFGVATAEPQGATRWRF